MTSAGETRRLGYAEFGRWYDDYRITVLEPALDLAIMALQDVLDDELSERDLARIRGVSGRVKSKRRTWRKLRHERYRGRVGVVDDIPHVIDDLVGLRVTCTNLRDIDTVQSALDALPRRPARRQTMWLDISSERDYVLEPKESGYRGWHVNIGVADPSGAVDLPPVTAELQVRTLLQDSWGELTHEDTYSKDGTLPPLVEVLSKRMADLFATLDDIAEDLRTELDRIDEAVVAEVAVEPAVGEGEPVAVDDDAVDSAADDAASLLRDRWERLDRPVDLASLAWMLQHEFGAEVSDDWFGYKTFKRFLRHAVPDGEISTGRQAYLLPAPPTARSIATSTADIGADADEPDTDVPPQFLQFHRADRGFPALDADRWPVLYVELADAWRRLGPRPATGRFVNQLTRSARDSAEAGGRTVSRRHLAYIAKAVVPTVDAGRTLDADEIAAAFADVTVQRMVDLHILGDTDGPAASAVRNALTTL